MKLREVLNQALGIPSKDIKVRISNKQLKLNAFDITLDMLNQDIEVDSIMSFEDFIFLNLDNSIIPLFKETISLLSIEDIYLSNVDSPLTRLFKSELYVLQVSKNQKFVIFK